MAEDISPYELIDLIAEISKVKVKEQSCSHPEDVVCQVINVAEVLSEAYSIVWRNNRT